MSSERVHDLLFLLSLSGLAAGCSKGVSGNGGAPFAMDPSAEDDDDEESDTDAPVEDDDDNGSTADPSITTDPSSPTDPTGVGTSGSDETTTGVSGPGSTGFPDVSTSDGSGPVGSTGTSTGGYGCPEYGNWAAMCYGYDDGQDWCYYNVDLGYFYYGPACAAAIEEYFGCLSTLACGAMGCAAESTAIDNAC